MRLLCRLGLVFGLTASLIAPAAALNREAFTITRYDLDVHLEPEQQRLGARGKIALRNDSAQPQKVVALQISSSLNWRSIRVDGKPVQFVSQPYVSDIDHTGALSEAIVTLPAEIKPKDSVELEIGYEGVIQLDTTRLTRIGVPEEIAKHSSWDQISPAFTAVRGAGYVAWYPITTESADFSEGNSLFEVVDRWKARETGSELKVQFDYLETRVDVLPSLLCGVEQGYHGRNVSSNVDSVRWESAMSCLWSPLGTVTPTFVIGRYVSPKQAQFGLHSFPGHEAGAATYSNAYDPATKFVTDWFGWYNGTVEVADFADPKSAPFESGTLLMASLAAEDSKLAGINLVHELIHSVLPSPRPWVYEGFAHFGEAMYRQEQGGRQAALDFLGLHRAAFLDSEKDVAAALQKNAAEEAVGQPLATTFDETYYRSKAAYVWWMLRDMVGDDALKQAIRKYRAADDNDKDPKYVEQLIEASAKRDLGWFFDDWVYHDRGLPDLRVQSVHPWKTDKGAPIITVTLENLGHAGAEVAFTISCEGGDVTKRIEVRAKSTATTRVELPGPATEIVVNDGSVPENELTNRVFKIPAP
jgi:hypothetical protein